MAEILHVVDGHVATVTLCNEERFNAVSLAMWQALAGALDELRDDARVRVVMLRGQGERAFAAGADISEFGARRNDPATVKAYDDAVTAAQEGIVRFRCPVIAAISGVCYGGGLGLALACDLRYAAPGARFRMPAARLGLGYGLTSFKRMVDVLGPSRTAELFYTARVCAAQEALAIGLVNAVHDDVFAQVQRVAQEIAANAPLTLAAAKLALNTVLAGCAAADVQAVDAAVRACFSSSDYAEGREAFAQKRAPRFTGH